MVRIVRTGRTIQKFSKNGKLLEGASFKTLEDAKRIEKDLISGKKKHVTLKG